MPRFYSVQSAVDAARLAAGGAPWPTGLQRANLGTGYYAWDSLEVAEAYREALLKHGATEVSIVVYEVADDILIRLKKLDLTVLSDDAVNTWMEKHSHYGDAEPHAWEYIVRHTDKGTEHYFAAAIFGQLKEVS